MQRPGCPLSHILKVEVRRNLLSDEAEHLFRLNLRSRGQKTTQLIDALASLRDLDWRLTCIGDTERAPRTARRLAARVGALGLSERVRVLGERTPTARTRRSPSTCTLVRLGTAGINSRQRDSQRAGSSLASTGLAASPRPWRSTPRPRR